MSLAALLPTLTRILPLVSSTAALICSVSQQFTMVSFLHPSIPVGSLHSLFGAWHTGFKKIVFVSAPAHLLTVVYCIINLNTTAAPSPYRPFSSSATAAAPWLWRAGILLTLLHAYPTRSKSAVEFFTTTEQQWRDRSPEYGLEQVKGFVKVNGQRLLFVDVPGWLCVFTAVVLSSSHACYDTQ